MRLQRLTESKPKSVPPVKGDTSLAMTKYVQLPLNLGEVFISSPQPEAKNLAVLHYGMGFDSTALLFDYLENPSRWDFEIACILIAQTGNESILIRNQVEAFVFPKIREHQIRTIQIARASSTQKDGYTVLEDSNNPTTCYYRPTLQKPYYTLYDDMLLSATVPQFAQNRRKCSDKFKAKILDLWHARNCPGCLKLICYNADEQRRVDKLKEESIQQPLHPVFCPLHSSGWTRKIVESRVKKAIAPHPFYRSACLICPFQFVAGSAAEVKAKYEADPPDAARTAFLEFVSTCFNPRQTLSSSEKTLIKRELLNPEIEALLEQELDKATWKVFDVRRIRSLKRPYRSVKTVFVGSRAQAQEHLRQLARKHKNLSHCQHGIARVYREAGPGCERFYVAAPSNPLDKERPDFAKQWFILNNEVCEEQIELL